MLLKKSKLYRVYWITVSMFTVVLTLLLYIRLANSAPNLYPYNTAYYDYSLISEYGTTHQISSTTLGQSFQPTETQVDGLLLSWLNVDGDPGTYAVDFTFYLCKGETTDQDFATSYDCTGNELIVAINKLSDSYSSTSSVHYELIEFPSTYNLEVGAWYYFSIDVWNTASTSFTTTGQHLVDLIPGDVLMLPDTDNFDIQFRLFKYFAGEDLEDYEVSDLCPDVKGVYTQTCLEDTDCNIQYWFNDLAIGSTIYLTPASPENFPEYAIDSEVIVETFDNSGFLTLPYSTGTSSYCFWLEYDELPLCGDSFRICGFEVGWASSTNYFPDMGQFDNPCLGLTDDSSFTYGVHCGLRRFSVWLFEPSEEALLKLERVMDDFKNNFPVNIFYLLDYSFNQALPVEGTPLEVPVVMWQAPGESVPTVKASVEMASSSLIGMTENGFFDNYYRNVELFIYLMGVLYLIARVFMISRKEANI